VRIVIDASIALKWVLDQPGSEAAVTLRDEELIAPALWLVEAANALWRNARLGQLTDDDAAERLSELLNAPVLSLTMEPYLRQAINLAAKIGHSVYDCLYLAVALHHETYVVTADRRFASAANLPGFNGRVRLLSPSMDRAGI
jgi:predicted nucleic acid-binding protein